MVDERTDSEGYSADPELRAQEERLEALLAALPRRPAPPTLRAQVMAEVRAMRPTLSMRLRRRWASLGGWRLPLQLVPVVTLVIAAVLTHQILTVRPPAPPRTEAPQTSEGVASMPSSPPRAVPKVPSALGRLQPWQRSKPSLPEGDAARGLVAEAPAPLHSVEAHPVVLATAEAHDDRGVPTLGEEARRGRASEEFGDAIRETEVAVAAAPPAETVEARELPPTAGVPAIPEPMALSEEERAETAAPELAAAPTSPAPEEEAPFTITSARVEAPTPASRPSPPISHSAVPQADLPVPGATALATGGVTAEQMSAARPARPPLLPLQEPPDDLQRLRCEVDNPEVTAPEIRTLVEGLQGFVAESQPVTSDRRVWRVRAELPRWRVASLEQGLALLSDPALAPSARGVMAEAAPRQLSPRDRQMIPVEITVAQRRGD